MSIFRKVDSPEWLAGQLSQYINQFEEKKFPLYFVFKFYENNGIDYIYRENTDKRNLFLLRSKSRIALRELDKDGKEIFYAERKIKIPIDDVQTKYLQVIHDLYVEELNK